MSAKSRTKGQTGEREIAGIIRDLTGWDVQRRVRQHEGDSDLEGIPGWCVEVKRHAQAPRASVISWWSQAVDEAQLGTGVPVLFYRKDRDDWRAVWPVAVLMTQQTSAMWSGYEWTCETTVEAWAAVARELCKVEIREV